MTPTTKGNESENYIDAALRYRDAMARVGSAVHIITSTGPAGRVGMTASAVCSVTDSPPTLLVCVNQKSSAHDVLIENNVLCVNTLGSQQEPVSRRFAAGGPMAVRFEGANWGTLETGSPVLDDALVAFDCRVAKATKHGTHTVLFCEVVSSRLPDADEYGLIYYDRKYHRLSRPREKEAA